MSVNVRPITGDEFDSWVAAVKSGFMMPPAATGEGAARLALHVDLHRTFAGFDGTHIVGTYRSFGIDLSMPGETLLPVAAVSAVTVQPTHRRQGFLSTAMQRDHRESCDRGEAASILIAAEWPIYGRFGYGPATWSKNVVVDASVSLTDELSDPGSVSFVELDQAPALISALHTSILPTQPGDIVWQPHWSSDNLGLAGYPGDKPYKGRVLVHRDKRGRIDGVLRYRTDGEFTARRPNVTLTVDELLSSNRVAWSSLWRFALRVDWVTTVKADNRPVDEPIGLLFTNGRAAVTTGMSDFTWLRVLDVSKLFTRRAYRSAVNIVIEVTDNDGFANGRYQFDVSPAGATVTRTRKAAHLTMPVTVLGAVALGGTSVVALHQAGQLDEHRRGAVTQAADVFGWPVAPWCSVWY